MITGEKAVGRDSLFAGRAPVPNPVQYTDMIFNIQCQVILLLLTNLRHHAVVPFRYPCIAVACSEVRYCVPCLPTLLFPYLPNP